MNSPRLRVELLPLGRALHLEPGTPLQDHLFAQGVEFPCGGRGRCKGCRIRVLSGHLPVTPDDQRLLAAEELAAGWRLACRAIVQEDLQVELAQWEAAILADDSVFAFTPREGLGVAVDLGTTTVVAQLLDLSTGHVLAVRAALNAQARHGADIMSRIEFATHGDGLTVLKDAVRRQIGAMISELLENGGHTEPLREIVLVGNTAMHHLFCGIPVAPLAHYPFEPADPGQQLLPSRELGWDLPGSPQVCFLSCLGGFVGGDLLAGALATRIHESADPAMLIDLGTNGEILLGSRHRILCASTAAGPAFEAARISMGMRAATGAISEVRLEPEGLRCHVLGGGPPRGICGSGLVDAVAAGLNSGTVVATGKLAQPSPWMLASPVALTQADIRELQLAKGAIAAGIRILLRQWGISSNDLQRVFLAGAFGNYINRASARRIGLLPFSPEQIQPCGNSALLGAKLALFDFPKHGGSYETITGRTQHFSLHDDQEFQDIFIEEMRFPDPEGA